MPENYNLYFLPLEYIEEDGRTHIDNGINGVGTNSESHFNNKPLGQGGGRVGATVETTGFDDSAYVSADILDDDGTLQDMVQDTVQVLGSDLVANGTTYPAGTEIHTGYGIEFDTDGDGIADLTVITINITVPGGNRVIGLASNQPIPANTTMTVVGGFNGTTYDNSGDIVDPGTLYCFAAGTMIAVPHGERPVEELAIGDPVLTSDGRTVPVHRIGRQTLHKMFAPRDRFEPVRVAAGALGPDLPHRDLVLTADHALILDGFAINAGALVNGGSVARVARQSMPSQVIYYHVETARHDVILANGVPAETFLDQGDRRKFDNYAEYLHLYGKDRVIAEMPLPRIGSARMVPQSLRARLAAASATKNACAG